MNRFKRVGLAASFAFLSSSFFAGAEDLAAAAESGPAFTEPLRLRLETARNGGRVTLTAVQIGPSTVATGRTRYVSAEDLIFPETAAYAMADSGNPILFGLPPGAPEPASSRAALVTDLWLNSGVFNIADQRDGLVFRFPEGLVNGPGPDLVVAEIGAAVGTESAAAPGVAAPGGDRFEITVRHADSRRWSADIGPQDYVAQGRLGQIANYAKEDDTALESLEEFDSAVAAPLATIDYMHLYAVVIDLSALGVPAGTRVSTLALRSDPIEAAGGRSDFARGGRYFYIDPVLVAGLPPADSSNPNQSR